MVNETENPFSQLTDVYKALDYMEINYIEATDCETDDMMASYALSFCDNANVVIYSFDSEFFQLISERISVLRYRGEKQWYVHLSILLKNMAFTLISMRILKLWWVILRTI